MRNAPDLRSWMVRLKNTGFNLSRAATHYVVATSRKSAIYQAKRMAGYEEADCHDAKNVILAEVLTNLE